MAQIGRTIEKPEIDVIPDREPVPAPISLPERNPVPDPTPAKEPVKNPA